MPVEAAKAQFPGLYRGLRRHELIVKAWQLEYRVRKQGGRPNIEALNAVRQQLRELEVA
jgi:hypothetical protein